MIWFDLFGLQSPQLVEHSCSATMTRNLNEVVVVIIIIIIIIIIVIIIIIIKQSTPFKQLQPISLVLSFNPLTPGAFCQKHIFGAFGDCQAGYGPNERLTRKGICLEYHKKKTSHTTESVQYFKILDK